MKCKGSKRKGALLHCSTVTTNVSESVYLLVRNVSGADSGAFECVANNGVGQEAKNTSFLLVRGESVIVQAISLILELFFMESCPLKSNAKRKVSSANDACCASHRTCLHVPFPVCPPSVRSFTKFSYTEGGGQAKGVAAPILAFPVSSLGGREGAKPKWESG